MDVIFDLDAVDGCGAGERLFEILERVTGAGVAEPGEARGEFCCRKSA